ncbi:MAG: hypothetical protein B7Z75_01750 [Acidocella sp. 20-57-95]|nr:MAG: hypothetical protein B7Z75_01750 [Acidocella sp. 20-57-95]HQT63724.1 DUF2892 domain-containing protein [Acidocella sp.]HQU05500.1 DUF2892 domain-containing protein [Acidocella sp.]
MKNMGTADRIIRLVIVLAIIAAYFGGLITGTVAIILGVAALVLFATSLFSTCPAYLPFGISTRRR